MAVRYASTMLNVLAALAFFACKPEAASPTPTTKAKKSETTSGTSKLKNCLAIVDGTETAGYPAVQPLFGATEDCSMTFVSSSAAITAAHCVDDTPTGGVHTVTADGRQVFAIKASNMGLTIKDQDELLTDAGGRKDIAVVVFPNGTSPAFLPVSQIDVGLSDAVTMVGYGYTDPDDPNSNSQMKKYFGGNVVSGKSDGAIYSWQHNDHRAANTAVAPGDSGGPLLRGGQIVGVAHASGMLNAGQAQQQMDMGAAEQQAFAKESAGGTLYTSVHLNIHESNVMGFLQKAVAQGVAITFAKAAAASGADKSAAPEAADGCASTSDSP